MNVLVTGGAGYIGSHFCKLISQFGVQPVVYDNLSTGHSEFVRWGPLVEGDLLELDKLTETLAKYRIDQVVHFAGKAIVIESVRQPELYQKNNVEGTEFLLQAMKAGGVRRLLFSSSCNVYGIAKKKLIDEQHEKMPINPYGRTKLNCEELILSAQRTGDLSKVGILRYFNVVGEDPDGELWEDHDPETHLVPNLAKAIVEGKPVYVYGIDFPTQDGSCERDLVDVVDLVDVHRLALEYLSLEDVLISNVGRGFGHSVLQVIRECEEVFGRKVVRLECPPRPGDAPSLVADSTYFNFWSGKKLRPLKESLLNLKKRYTASKR